MIDIIDKEIEKTKKSIVMFLDSLKQLAELTLDDIPNVGMEDSRFIDDLTRYTDLLTTCRNKLSVLYDLKEQYIPPIYEANVIAVDDIPIEQIETIEMEVSSGCVFEDLGIEKPKELTTLEKLEGFLGDIETYRSRRRAEHGVIE